MNESPPPTAPPRRPRVFSADDPRLSAARAASAGGAAAGAPATPDQDRGASAASEDALDDGETGPTGPTGPAGRASRGRFALPTLAGVSSGVQVGALFLSAVVALATLAATVSFFNFVQVALARDDWVGWLAAGLLGVAALTGLVLIGREGIGLLRLARLGRLRRDLEAAVTAGDPAAERAGLARLKALYITRPEMRWPLASLAEHEGDVHDPGALLRLADRTLMAPLDHEARRLVLRSAKRVATVSALSPMALITVAYVLAENIGLLRALAGLYGGRPGVLGSLRLARLVFGHMLGTGSVALTEDLLGQFIGQDMLRRLSARLGEGAFNAALTARLGAAAIDVVRPLPFVETPPVRARDIAAELFRSTPEDDPPPAKA